MILHLFSSLSLAVSNSEALTAFVLEFTDGMSTGAIVEALHVLMSSLVGFEEG